jgi:DNA repair protein RadC
MVAPCGCGSSGSHLPGPLSQGDRSGDLEARILHDACCFELPVVGSAVGGHRSAAARRRASETLEWIISRGTSQDPVATAKSLLDEFGTVSAVLGAGPGRMRHVAANDRSATFEIKAFQAAMLHILRENVAARPVVGNWSALLEHLRREIGHNAAEQFRVLHLDARNGLISEEVASFGSVDTAVVHVREVVRRALDVGAAAIVVVHNHPSGDARPSEADIKLTRHLVAAASLFDISVVDHLIITAGSHTSMRAEGLIR